MNIVGRRTSKFKGCPSEGLLPTLERPSISSDLLAVLTHRRSPFGHSLRVFRLALGLELVAVLSEPGFAPGAAPASRRNAGLAVFPRPAPAFVAIFLPQAGHLAVIRPGGPKFDFQTCLFFSTSLFRRLLAKQAPFQTGARGHDPV